MIRAALLLALAAAPGSAPGQGAPAGRRSPAEVIAAAPADAWREIAPDNLVVMDLGPGRRVLIELAPAFAPTHVANLKRLALERWFDGTAVVRVQDNYVTQWGDPDSKKPLPAGVVTRLAPEWDHPSATLRFDPVPGPDGYGEPGFVDGFPAARTKERTWLVHCYGAVGVGRDAAPDSGNASELYTVIGHAPRNLDRNYQVVGRVVLGIEHLSSLPRGTGALGFYERPEQRVSVTSLRLASSLPAAERPAVEVLQSGTQTFAAYVAARAARPDFLVPHRFVDLCNIRPPARPKR